MSNRSWLSQTYVFWPHALRHHYVHPQTIKTLDFILAERNPDVPDVIVFLSDKPEACYERCLLRKRKGDENLTLEYFEEIDQLHSLWLDKSFPAHVIPIDISGMSCDELKEKAIWLLNHLKVLTSDL